MDGLHLQRVTRAGRTWAIDFEGYDAIVNIRLVPIDASPYELTILLENRRRYGERFETLRNGFDTLRTDVLQRFHLTDSMLARVYGDALWYIGERRSPIQSIYGWTRYGSDIKHTPAVYELAVGGAGGVDPGQEPCDTR